jgi:hypothetical protein
MAAETKAFDEVKTASTDDKGAMEHRRFRIQNSDATIGAEPDKFDTYPIRRMIRALSYTSNANQKGPTTHFNIFTPGRRGPAFSSIDSRRTAADLSDHAPLFH